MCACVYYDVMRKAPNHCFLLALRQFLACWRERSAYARPLSRIALSATDCVVQNSVWVFLTLARTLHCRSAGPERRVINATHTGRFVALLQVTVTLYWLSQQLATSVLGGPSSAFSNDPCVTSVRPVDPSLFSAGNVIHRRQSSVFSDTESLASSGYVTSGMPVRHSAGFDSVCGTSLDSLDDSCSRPPSSSSAAASATSSGPPARFHKPDASDLARAAERQMEVARMNRKLASSTAVAAKGDDDEWRSVSFSEFWVLCRCDLKDGRL